MKKLIAMILCALMLVSIGVSAEENEKDDRFAASVTGAVLEITEEGALILKDEEGMAYEAQITAETDRLDAEEVNVGDIVTVWYNGKLTRSIPAQLTATKVSCFFFTGTVGEVTEEGFILTTAEEMAVFVNVPAGAAASPIVEGTTVTVYYDGKMTRSYPGQITALKVRLIDLSGEIIAVNEDGSLTLRDETMGEVIVHLSEETAVYAEITIGETVRVSTNGIMAMSLPAQFVAVEVLPGQN